ncbi:MAG: NAD-dependent deacetylase [Spirochaetia bacterium]|nr:NAD-dependent deacetylase [Spirochaetia bacterium]
MSRLVELGEHMIGSSYLTVFTGAGVSTLSGLPDFRGAGGLYSSPESQRIFDYEVFLQQPEYFYTQVRELLYSEQDIRPSIVHTVLAELEDMGIVRSIITQNIDMLHERAGSRHVCAIHGSALQHHCISCGAQQTIDEVRPAVLRGQVPTCRRCSGVMKPDITFFGEALPVEAFEAAIRESSRSDCMLILGSSLLVQPAASLPLETLRRGGEIIIVNRGPTPLDDLATLRFEDLREVFSHLQGVLCVRPSR